MGLSLQQELPHTFTMRGATPCPAGITSWLYTPPLPAAAGGCALTQQPSTVPIGHAVHNARLYVLDKQLQPVPLGLPGQLYISGVAVAGGYINRPDLTAASFVRNPFAEGPGTHTDVMYATGDAVRWLPATDGPAAGALEYVGRLDFQTKLRGFRIELQVRCFTENLCLISHTAYSCSRVAAAAHCTALVLPLQCCPLLTVPCTADAFHANILTGG
jgi:acyl-CoA synthetase (AMP-forming)/AMP-acid ligase II